MNGNKQKIVLYFPPTGHERFYSFYWIPYSLLTIASMVCDQYEVIIIDGNLCEPDLDLEFLCRNTLCVGVSCMTGYQIKGGLEFSKTIKAYNMNIPIIWGGTILAFFLKLLFPTLRLILLSRGKVSILLKN